MSLQGSWCTCYALIDKYLQSHIVGSEGNFAKITLTEPAHISQQPSRKLYLRHVNEIHCANRASITAQPQYKFTLG